MPYNVVPELDDDGGRRDRRAGRRQHGRRSPRSPGSSTGCAPSATGSARCSIFDEVITGFRLDTGRRPGQVRRHARPHDVRQGDRRRPADRRRRRPARGDGDAVAARPGVPRRHAGRQPARHGRRAGRARPARRRRLHRAVGPGPAARRRCCATPARRPGSPAQFPVVGTLVGIVCGDVPDAGRLRRRQAHRRGAPTRAFFQAMLAEGVALAPGAYEAIFVGLGHDDAVIEEIGRGRRAGLPGRPCAATGTLRLDAAGPLVAIRRRRSSLLGAFALVVYIRRLVDQAARASPAPTTADVAARWTSSRSSPRSRADGFAMTANDTVERRPHAGDARTAQNVTVVPRHARASSSATTSPSPYQCAVLGQSLGDTVVWFALMPMRGAEFRFELPAIVDLEDGFARLVNGWQVPYAQVDRPHRVRPRRRLVLRVPRRARHRVRLDLRPQRASHRRRRLLISDGSLRSTSRSHRRRHRSVADRSAPIVGSEAPATCARPPMVAPGTPARRGDRKSTRIRLNVVACSIIRPWAAPLMTTSSAVGISSASSSLSPRGVRMSWLPTTTSVGTSIVAEPLRQRVVGGEDRVDLGGEGVRRATEAERAEPADRPA